MIEVFWQDAYASCGPPPDEPDQHVRRTVGFQVRADDDFLIVAQTFDEDGYDDYIVIPRCLMLYCSTLVRDVDGL